MPSGLDGAIVVLTRQPEDNVALAARLRVQAAEIVELPCVRTEAVNVGALASAIRSLGADDWLVVTSRHGADAVAGCGAVRAAIAAVGDRTAARLRTHGLPVAFEPTSASGERLARELPKRSGIVLLARSDRALPDLPAILRTRGFVVREVAAYRTIPGAWGDVVRVRALLESSDPHVAVIFHSPSAIEGLLTAIGPRLVARAAIYVAGQTTLRAARERLGVEERISLFEEEPADVTHR